MSKNIETIVPPEFLGNPRLKIAIQAAVDAGKAIKQIPVNEYDVTHKAGKDNLRTACDLASQEIILDAIKGSFPKDATVSEEREDNDKTLLTSNNVWIIDPIDGTSNLANRIPYYCVSIGYAERGIPQLGVIYNPSTDELFFANRGRGAYMWSQRLTVGNDSDIHTATLGIDRSYVDEETEMTLHFFRRLKGEKTDPTPFMRGCSVLEACQVAAGRLGFFFSIGHEPWDNAAAHLIVREAGGAVKDFANTDATLLSRGWIAGNAQLIAEFFQKIKLTA